MSVVATAGQEPVGQVHAADIARQHSVDAAGPLTAFEQADSAAHPRVTYLPRRSQHFPCPSHCLVAVATVLLLAARAKNICTEVRAKTVSYNRHSSEPPRPEARSEGPYSALRSRAPEGGSFCRQQLAQPLPRVSYLKRGIRMNATNTGIMIKPTFLHPPRVRTSAKNRVTSMGFPLTTGISSRFMGCCLK